MGTLEHVIGAQGPFVGFVGGCQVWRIPVVCFTQDKDVVSTSEGVPGSNRVLVIEGVHGKHVFVVEGIFGKAC